MRLAFFEDRAATDFGPLVALRPAFDLVCGRRSTWDRLRAWFRPGECGAFVRNELAETCREEHPGAVVNDFAWLRGGNTLLVNARWLPAPESLAKVAEDEVGVIDGQVAWLTLDPLEAALLADVAWDDALVRIARTRRFVETTGRLLSRPWDLVAHNGRQLEDDHACWSRGGDDQTATLRGCDELPTGVAVLGPLERVTIDRSASIDPFVVIDARGGPVSVEADAVIQPFTRLEGPCHVGRRSQLFRANVRGGTTIGPDCRVGGEVEGSILHGCVNKYHDGFLGHGYVGPWVNLGALTTNSDLKNDYSPVRVPLDGEPIDAGATKVGCFVGDHTKTAIGSLFNTGSSIGVMCLVLPGGELLPRHVPSFARVWHGEIAAAWDLERSLQTARIAMRRRNRELTPAAERLLRRHYDATRLDREAAIARDRADRDRRETPYERRLV